MEKAVGTRECLPPPVAYPGRIPQRFGSKVPATKEIYIENWKPTGQLIKWWLIGILTNESKQKLNAGAAAIINTQPPSTATRCRVGQHPTVCNPICDA